MSEHWQDAAERLRASLPEERMRADALRRVAIGLDLPEGFTIGFDETPLPWLVDEFASAPRVSPAPDEVRMRGDGTRSAAGAALRSVTPSGHRTDSPAYRAFRCARRRALYRIRAVAWVLALLLTVVTVGAFAADRPVAGVLSSALVFILLRTAAEARAEL